MFNKLRGLERKQESVSKALVVDSSDNLVVKNNLEVLTDATILGDLGVTGTITGSITGNASTLDGLDSTQFLRSDQTDTMAGQLLVQGVDANGPVATDEVRLSGYGIVGNRGALYVTNNGPVQIGVGGTHNQNPVMTFSSTTVQSHKALSVTGNISVTGTVDGRDVATDGSKLDGIEAGATADQTAAEILTAIKTVDGSTSGLDADLLDGLDSTQFLRSDQSDTFSGNLTVDNGVNTTVTILSDDAGMSSLNLYGGLQGTGRVYVGQSTSHGGGVEYNGDGIPTTVGAPSDTIAFFRRDADVDSWVMYYGYAADTVYFRGNINVANSITVTGTVDGRDVATDGAKLDGIEAGADVTDTTNVTAAGALMDSEVTNLAAVKAFNPASYATAAQGTLADQALSANYLNTRSIADANLADTEGVEAHYLTGAAINDPAGTDHALLSLNFSNAYSYQIAGDWRTDHMYVRSQTNTAWGTWKQVFTDSYHPNADTLTTARTISLGGDVTGSASFNGSSNITITATVADDSHNHTTANVDGLDAALALKAPLASPTFSGIPAVPTAVSTTNTTQIASTAYVKAVVADLVDGAPGTIDTLNELAAALGDDPNFATTVTNSLATKMPLTGGTFTGSVSIPATTTKMDFGSNTRQMIDLWSTSFGIGVQSGTTYVRTSDRFSVHLGGVHSNVENDPGTGGFNTFTVSGSEIKYYNNHIFRDDYHPNADKLTTARNIALTGDVTGSTNFDGSGNVSITATIADDSHNHIIANVDGLQTALDGKLASGATAVNSQLLDSLDSTQFLRSDTSDTMTGTLTLNGVLDMTAATTESRYLEIGKGRTGNGFAYIDMVGDATYTDYGFRIIRSNSGANTNSDLIHRGTGSLRINAQDAADVIIKTANTDRLTITSAGDVLFGADMSLGNDTAATTTVTQTQVASWTAASFDSGKILIQVRDNVSGEVQMSELLVAHDGTTASATEYALIFTGAAILASFDVDINAGNVRILATAASTNSTDYTVSKQLLV